MKSRLALQLIEFFVLLILLFLLQTYVVLWMLVDMNSFERV
jgi:hypothetical protein